MRRLVKYDKGFKCTKSHAVLYLIEQQQLIYFYYLIFKILSKLDIYLYLVKKENFIDANKFLVVHKYLFSKLLPAEDNALV